MNWKKNAFKENRSYILILLAMAAGTFLPAGAQVELRYEQNESVTWGEAIEMYRWLDTHYEDASLMEVGTTDAGRPLHLFVIDRSRKFDPDAAKNSGKSILLINNGIHPGEPCGIDASLKLARDLLSGEDSYASYLDHAVVLIVPILNVGGALNRSAFNRANQNGPVEQGFRGNARNLDLNRDFIKLDSRNTQSLVRVIRQWDPDLFVDTHTSDGADYPYTLTLINSHVQRHEASQARLIDSTLIPALYEGMEKSPYKMCPYVQSRGRSPEQGIQAFMDYPRYTSGYASLFNTIAFTLETHMFKPFEDRVLSTWYFLREALKFSSTHSSELSEIKERAWQEKLQRDEFTLQWSLDDSRFDTLLFMGYGVKEKKSRVSGLTRYYYDRAEPWEKEVPYYKYFRAVCTAQAPEYYVLPSAWSEVVERLQLNGVEMFPLVSDSTVEAEIYYIDSFETARQPYNGHYRHSDVKVSKRRESIGLLAGDYLIPVRQRAREYLVQTLEPEGYDSFFSWNFFDEILFRNEYFSPYIFEETAEKLLREDPQLRKEFEEKRKAEPAFAGNAYQQLRFIYERSPWSEPTYMRYPVYRLN